MQIIIDKQSDIPIGKQIERSIEFAISLGYFDRNNRLPSIRDLARELQVAPLTVRRAYDTLEGKDLIIRKSGQGTFVNAPNKNKETQSLQNDFLKKLDSLIQEGLKLGLSPEILQSRILQATHTSPKGLNILLLGAYQDSAHFYQSQIRPYLEPHDNIEVAIYNEWTPAAAETFDAIITLPHLGHAVRQSTNDQKPVFTPYFIPSGECQQVLSTLPPHSKVGILVHEINFLSFMIDLVRQYCPLLSEVKGGQDSQASLLSQTCDILLFSAGCEIKAAQAHFPNVRCYDLFFTPDPHYLKNILAPALSQLRQTIQS